MGVCIILTPFCLEYFATTDARFWTSAACLFLFGAWNGMSQGTVFGLGSILPGEYLGAIMFGNGVAGVATNVLRMILLLLWPDTSLYAQMLIFFTLSTAFMFVSALCYSILIKNKFYQFYYALAETRHANEEA